VRWHIVSPEDTAVLRFDDEALVFNPSSWETHLLNEAAALVLDALVAGPRSVDEIVAQVESEVAVPEDFAGQVDALLGQLESLGLVAAAT
jgi:PqqD family protein of HPr-rel-A system